MKMCLGRKTIQDIEYNCPLIDMCARAHINRVAKEVFKEAPYDFTDDYCKHFFWKGYKSKK